MAKKNPKIAKAPVNREKVVFDYESRKKKIEKIRMWAFIIWVFIFMLIMAKWGRFNLWS